MCCFGLMPEVFKKVKKKTNRVIDADLFLLINSQKGDNKVNVSAKFSKKRR